MASARTGASGHHPCHQSWHAPGRQWRHAEHVHAAVIEQLIDRVAPIVTMERDALESPAVGEGTDVRFATDRISGALLVREGRVVHAEVHRLHA